MPPSFSSTIQMPTFLISCHPLSHRLPPPRDLSIHSPHVHPAQIPSPLAPPLVQNPTRRVLIHAKRNATLGPAHLTQLRFEITRPCRCGGTTRSLPCHQIHNSGPSDHPAEESETLCDRPCTVLALGQEREMDLGMGMGLGKSRGDCTSVS
jgi:hypothetical protein